LQPLHIENFGSNRPSKSQSAESASRSHLNSYRANAGRNQFGARRTRSPPRPSTANEEGIGAVAGKNRSCSGGLQKMAPERSAPAFGRRFSPRRREVSKKVAFRARVGLVDGRNLEARAGR